MSEEKKVKAHLSEIENAISMLGHKIENYVENSGRSHETVQSGMSTLDSKQEKLESKMDSFFESILSLKEELSRMNINMAAYNAQLTEHMRRTAVSESRLEKMEDIAKMLIEKDTRHESELIRLKIIGSTVVKVFIAISGAIGLAWTVIQIFDKIK